jgi:hypothetical protein
MAADGMACMNQTWPHCVNHLGKTQSKPLAEQHGMCESTFNLLEPSGPVMGLLYILLLVQYHNVVHDYFFL